jgi:predicted porin
MNKKLITLAVAAAMTAPAAALAEATLYGKLNVSLDYANVKNVVLPTYSFLRDPNTGAVYRDPVTGAPIYAQTRPGQDFDGWGMSGNGYIPGEGRASRVGVKGSEDLGGGLKAIYQVEFGVNLNDTDGNLVDNADAITYRNTFVGLAGNFGTVLLGRHDTPMKISTAKLDLFADTMADYNGTVGFRDLRADNVVAYISPSFSGFQFAGAVIPAGGSTGFGANNYNLNSNSIAEGYSLAAIYSNGPFYGSVAYEALGNELDNTQNTSLNFSDCPYEVPNAANRVPTDSYFSGCTYQNEDSTAWRVGLGLLDWNGFSLTGIYENRDEEPGSGSFFGFTDPTNPALSWRIPGAASQVELWQVQAGYAFGNNMIKGMYGQADYSADIRLGAQYVVNAGGQVWAENLDRNVNRNVETWGIGFDHNFSKRTKAYALYTAVTDDAENVMAGSEWSGFSLGMVHSF